MEQHSISEPEKIDLAPWGYAPGFSFFYCTDCNSPDPEQGHRNSTRCARHALLYLHLLQHKAEMDAIPKAPVIKVSSAKKECNSNLILRLMFGISLSMAASFIGISMFFSG